MPKATVVVDDGVNLDVKEVEVSIGSAVDTKASYNDAFSVEGVELKKIDGLTAYQKRKAGEIQKAYTGMEQSGSHAIEIQAFSAYDAFDVVVPPYNMDYLAKVYEVSSPHFAAVNIKTQNIVGLGYSWVETQDTKDMLEDVTGAEKMKKVRKKLGRARQDLDDWLEETNDEDTFIEVLQKVWIDYEATGNGYIEVGRTPNGSIGYIGHVSATTMRVRRKRDGFVQVVSNRATFFRNFGDLKTVDPLKGGKDNNEVIQIKKYTPTQTFYGIPDIISAAAALAGDEFASRYNLDYFEYKAVPRYVIVAKGAALSATAEKRIHEFFLTNLKGKNHRSLYIPLPADSENSRVEFKIEPVEAGIQDASFINYNKMNRDTILMAHRVPLSKVSSPEGVALAATRDADKTFKETVARPEQDKFENKLNRIIKEKTDVFTLKLNEMSLTDEDQQSQIDERDIRSSVMLPNEIRARRGLGPHEFGDQPPIITQQEMADELARLRQGDKRDAQRSAGQTDGVGEGRNTQGAGRNTA